MSIVDWIYPKICVACGREGEYICDSCRKKLIQPPPICPMCCRPSAGGYAHARCKKRYGIDRLSVALPYKGPVQKALKKVKYSSTWDVAKELAEYCLERKMETEKIENWIVTWIPMYKQKQKERGFNQAEIIAKQMAKVWGVDSEELLVRTIETKPMFGLSKKERRENIRAAFQAKSDSGVMPQKIFLVDDVWTTGATMREGAKTLKIAGSKIVWSIALAR